METKVQHPPDTLTTEQEYQDSVPHLKRHSIMPPGGDANRRESRFRRPSIQHSRRMSTVSRTSMSGMSLGMKHIGLFPVKLQNTYKVEPDKKDLFQPVAVRETIQQVLDECLDGEVYNAQKCRNLSQMLSEAIKGRVKDMGFPRYKLVCKVALGQDAGQGASVVSRFLWNKDTDNYAEASYNKDGLFAVATVYAVYCE